MKVLVLLFLAIFLSGCSQSRPDEARALYSSAVQAFSKNKIGSAKLALDSLIRNYSDVPAVVKDARTLLRTVRINEQVHLLAHLDSQLVACESLVRPLMDIMVIDDPHAPIPLLVHKNQKVARSFDRCCLRAYVDQGGVFSLSSNFVGEKGIAHYKVEVVSDEYFVRTDSVGEEPFNHSFSDGEQVWEIVKYGSESSSNVGGFVASHAGSRIVVRFVGSGSFVGTMPEADRRAIADVWQLSCLIRESVAVRSQMRQVRMRINKLKQSQG